MTGTWRDVTEADGEWWNLPVERLRAGQYSIDDVFDTQIDCQCRFLIVYAKRTGCVWSGTDGFLSGSRRIQILEPAWTYYNCWASTQAFWRTDGTRLYITQDGGKSWAQWYEAFDKRFLDGFPKPFPCDSTGKRLEPEKPDVVAWTFLTVPELTMRAMAKSNSRAVRVEFFPAHVLVLDEGSWPGEKLSYQEFLDKFVQLDGSPCGETRNNK